MMARRIRDYCAVASFGFCFLYLAPQSSLSSPYREALLNISGQRPRPKAHGQGIFFRGRAPRFSWALAWAPKDIEFTGVPSLQG